MTSDRQTEANRLNAQKSTGPTSPEGKARSSQNALKTGIDAKSEIIRGEDPAQLELLALDYQDAYSPATPAELTQVKILIRADWELDRMARAEASIWTNHMAYGVRHYPESPLGAVYQNCETSLMRLGRRVEVLQRSSQRANRELERLQANRRAAQSAGQRDDPAQPQDPEPAPPPQPAENTQPIGFVPPEPTGPAPISSASRQTVVPAPGTAAVPPKFGFSLPKSGNSRARSR